MMAELKINVGDIDAAGKHFSFPLRAAWIRGVLEDHEATTAGPDGLLDIRVSKSGNDVVVHGTLSAELVVPCARCLTPVPLHIDQQLSLLYVPGKVTPPPVAGAAKEAAPKEAGARDKASKEKGGKPDDAKRRGKKRAELEEFEISAEDADTLPYEGDIVVLDDVIRDELILETPIFPLCSEDCPGMSAPPGASLGATGAGETNTGTKSSSQTNGKEIGDRSTPTSADIDPRLLPLLSIKTKRD